MGLLLLRLTKRIVARCSRSPASWKPFVLRGDIYNFRLPKGVGHKQHGGGERTRVLIEQIGAVDAQQLGDLIGHLTPEEQWGIDEALATVLGLD